MEQPYDITYKIPHDSRYHEAFERINEYSFMKAECEEKEDCYIIKCKTYNDAMQERILDQIYGYGNWQVID